MNDSPPRIRVVIADDHPLMRGALCQAVLQAVPGADITEADMLSKAVDAVRLHPPDAPCDLVLLDLHMPGMNGFSGLFLLRAEFHALPVLVVSACDDADTIRRAQQYGASGFVSKSARIDQIATAIHAVLAGDIWFADTASTPPGRFRDEADLAHKIASLTPQQLRVLLMITEGKLNKQIAWEIGVSEATVKAHVTMILRKLHVSSRTQAVIVARRLDVDRERSIAENADHTG